MKREALATGGALGLSVLIASCCLGPALFLLFGVSVGALGWFSIFEPLRPYLIALGGVLLLYAGLRIHRTPQRIPEVECGNGACAPGSRSRRLSRGLFWIVSGIYIVAVAYPAVVEALYR